MEDSPTLRMRLERHVLDSPERTGHALLTTARNRVVNPLDERLVNSWRRLDEEIKALDGRGATKIHTSHLSSDGGRTAFASLLTFGSEPKTERPANVMEVPSARPHDPAAEIGVVAKPPTGDVLEQLSAFIVMHDDAMV